MIANYPSFANYTVEREFVAYKNLKIRWCEEKHAQHIKFYISDYLADSPPEIIDDLLNSLMDHIIGRRLNPHSVVFYSQKFLDYVNNPEYARLHQRTFIRRHRSELTTDAEYQNLDQVVQRLKDYGFVPDIPDMKIFWSDTEDFLASSSIIGKVVILSKRLDIPDIPEYVLDSLVYDQMMLIDSGYLQNGQSARFEPHPQMLDAMEWVHRRFGLEVKV
jgi:hypothetical protein